MRKIILYIAMSLDGYIADEKGGVDWLVGEKIAEFPNESYRQFISRIDTIIMGYRTYHQIITELSKDKWYYQGYKSYILTHQNIFEYRDDILFRNEDIQHLLLQLCNEEGKDIWICGGADIVHQCLQYDLIDEFYITIIPTLLGKGIPLFQCFDKSIPLQLVSHTDDNGMIELVYKKRLK